MFSGVGDAGLVVEYLVMQISHLILTTVDLAWNIRSGSGYAK